MSQHGTENQSHDHSESARKQDGGPNLVAIALAALSAIVTVIWVIPGVVENWNHWWMKLPIVALGFGIAFFFYAIFRRTAKWPPSKAFLAATAIGSVYFIILAIAWVGGDMPMIISAIRSRFSIAILLTVLAIFSWAWAILWKHRPSANPGPSHPATMPATTPTTQTEGSLTPNEPKLTLKQLFDTDFGAGGLNIQLTFEIIDGEYKCTQLVPFRIIGDFIARSKYVACFVRSSAFSFKICEELAETFRRELDEIDKKYVMRGIRAGDSAITLLSELTFSGRVIVYHEDHFSLSQLSELESIFKSKGAAVIFRGHHYHVLHWNEKRPNAVAASSPKNLLTVDPRKSAVATGSSNTQDSKATSTISQLVDDGKPKDQIFATTFAQANRRFAELRDSIKQLHDIKNKGEQLDELQRLQKQVMALYFDCVDKGLLSFLQPPLVPDERGPLFDWKNLAAHAPPALVPPLDSVGSGKVGDIYIDPLSGPTGWINHAVPLVSWLIDKVGQTASLEEAQPISTVEAPRLSVLTPTGSRDVMDNDPPWVHLGAIKDSAANLRGSLKEIRKMVVRNRERDRRSEPLGEIERAIRIKDSERLTKYHELRIALVREVEKYLPEVRIPTLRDFTKAWRWSGPLPDQSKMTAELEEIEHQANLAAVKERNKPPPPIGIDNPGRTFAVNNTHLGNWPPGATFTEYEFHCAVPNGNHDDLLRGHLAKGAIRLVAG